MGKTPRCKQCNKKTITGFTCSCGNYYCIIHRDHKCEEHYKKIEKDKEILKNKLMTGSTNKTKVTEI